MVKAIIIVLLLLSSLVCIGQKEYNPIKFDVKKYCWQNVLTWSIERGEEANYFCVEVYYNNKDWQEIAEVKATEKNDYYFLDDKLHGKGEFYRIIEVDCDRNITYSKQVFVVNKLCVQVEAN